jgi:hypothetical protein
MKEDLGYANVESKLAIPRTKKEKSEMDGSVSEEGEFARSHSAEKFESLI